MPGIKTELLAVKAYTLSVCPNSRKVRQFFQEQRVPFSYIDLDSASAEEQKQLMDKVFHLSGVRALPVVQVGGQVILGWDEAKLRAALLQ